MHIEINLPYSVSEIFNPNARARLSELRLSALELFNGDKKKAWAFICKPHTLHNEKSLFELSEESPSSHQEALSHIGRIEHGVCV